MKKGFTLVEVTVALAIFAIGTVVLTQSFIGGMFTLESFKFDNDEDDALMFVYDKVISLKGRADLENGGSINTANSGVAKWSGTVAPTTILELYKLVLHVSFENEKFPTKRKTYREEFYLYRPEWALLEKSNAFLMRRDKTPKP